MSMIIDNAASKPSVVTPNPNAPALDQRASASGLVQMRDPYRHSTPTSTPLAQKPCTQQKRRSSK